MTITRTFDILERYQAYFPKEDALASKANGKWTKYSTQQYVENANYVSYGLLALGIKKGDKIASVSNNRPEWNFLDMGLAQIGAVHVPIYPTIGSQEYEYILNHSEVKLLFVSDKQLYKKLKPIADKIPHIEKVYSFNEIEEANHWSEIPNLGKKSAVYFQKELPQIKKSISPHDIATIIYTSGTTGVSKGVMLSHDNFVSNFVNAIAAMPLDHSHKVLSFLPLCHVYERLLNYVFQYKGISIYYAENIGTIVENLKEIKADGFDTVPRLLEKVFDTIMSKGKDLKGIKRKIFYWAVHLGLRYELDGKNGWFYEQQLKLANKLVFSKWREALGGNIKYIGSGGAALQERLARIFWAARIPIQEGYGLTETSPLIAFNFPKTPFLRLGTVGPVLKGVEVKIAEDGEILVKGANIMLGYFKNEELTREVIGADGWFHTGDIGTLVDGKYLKITDRKKEMFKTSSGKYIAPQVIENKLKEDFFIEQAMVVGENQKFASALISPKFEVLQKWCAEKNISNQNNSDIIRHPQVLELFQKNINNINKMLGEFEKIKRFRLVGDEWTPQTGELSPTLKLKRKFIRAKYEHILEAIYNIKEDFEDGENVNSQALSVKRLTLPKIFS